MSVFSRLQPWNPQVLGPCLPNSFGGNGRFRSRLLSIAADKFFVCLIVAVAESTSVLEVVCE